MATDVQINRSELQNGLVERYQTYNRGNQVSFYEAMALLEGDKSFRDLFVSTLKNSKHKAFFFETPKINSFTVKTTHFEYVLVQAPGLSGIKPDSDAFTEHFAHHEGETVVNFLNLGGDALLVAPCPVDDDHSKYTHVAEFCRNANEKQIDDFWKCVGEATLKRITQRGGKPTWLSTSGSGVYWLHVRLDSRPKYYTFMPYKTDP